MDDILENFLSNNQADESSGGHIKLKIRANFNRFIKDKVYEFILHMYDRIKPISNHETIDIVKRTIDKSGAPDKSNNSEDFVKTMIFHKGIQDKKNKQYCKKKGLNFVKIYSKDNQLSWKMIEYLETPLNKNIGEKITVDNAHKILIKNKLIFTIKNIDLIYFHVTLFKKVDKNNMTHVNFLKFIKNSMFPSDTSTKQFMYINAWNVCDDVTLELYINKEILEFDKIINITPNESDNNDQLNKLKNNIHSSIRLIEEYFHVDDQDVNYASVLGMISKYISPKSIKKYMSEKWGLRNMTYSVVSLDMIGIYDKILTNKSEYLISPKIDGERCIIYYDSNNELIPSDSFDTSNGSEYDTGKVNNLYLVTHDLLKINIINEKNKDLCIIADAEMVKTKNGITLHIFDVMYYNPGYIQNTTVYNNLGSGIHKCGYGYSNRRKGSRQDEVTEQNTSDDLMFGYMPYIKSGIKPLNSKINFTEDAYETRISYIDAIVNRLNKIVSSMKDTEYFYTFNVNFIKKNICCLSDIDEEKHYNAFINNTDLITQDKLEGSSEVPLDGIILTKKRSESYNKTESWKWKPKKFATIDFLIKDDSLMVGRYMHGKYMAVRFAPHDYPLIYKYFDLGDISELAKMNSDQKDKSAGSVDKIGEFYWTGKKWKLLRIRHDRQNDVKRGNYFGNDVRTAETIWQGIKNHIDTDILHRDDIMNKLPNINSICIQSIFTKYIKQNNKNIMLFANNTIFDKLDLYNAAQKLVQGSKFFIFTSGYTETWIIRNIYDNKKEFFQKTPNVQNNLDSNLDLSIDIVKDTSISNQTRYLQYYDSICICPPAKKIIKKTMTCTYENMEMKGIQIPKKKVELIAVVYKNLNINIDRLPKLVGFIKHFLHKNGKVIILKYPNASSDDIIEVMETHSLILELHTSNLISFVGSF